jgi:hypothetical protein
MCSRLLAQQLQLVAVEKKQPGAPPHHTSLPIAAGDPLRPGDDDHVRPGRLLQTTTGPWYGLYELHCTLSSYTTAVAIFHASFHPTQGNVLDWSLKASPELDLSQLEFNCLPSGLHLVDSDVVYFSKGVHRGVCIFRRRQTTETGHRGFRLSSLGVLLAPSARPRPWRHASSLQSLVTDIFARLEESGVLQPTERDWDLARAWFEARKVRRSDLGGAGDWRGWSDELDDVSPPST